MQADIKTKKSHTCLFRQLCKSVIKDLNIWADRNAEMMEKEYEVLLACRGKP